MSQKESLTSLSVFQGHRHHGLSVGQLQHISVGIGHLHVHDFDDVVSHRQPVVMQRFHRLTRTPRIGNGDFSKERMFLISDQRRLHQITIHHGRPRRFDVGQRSKRTIEMTERPLLVSRKIDLHLTLRDALVVALHVAFQGPVGLVGGSTIVSKIAKAFVMRIGSEFPSSAVFLFDESKMFGHHDVESEDGRTEATMGCVQDDFLAHDI